MTDCVYKQKKEDHLPFGFQSLLFPSSIFIIVFKHQNTSFNNAKMPQASLI